MSDTTGTSARPGTARIVLAWLVVGLPLAFGVGATLLRATALFTG